jgi:hypothetical protein
MDGPPAGVASAGAAGSAGAGTAIAGSGPIVNGQQALQVELHDIEGMTVEMVVLGCAGDCAQVAAVAHGGNPPYRYRWHDGSTSERRRVCVEDSAGPLSVTASDTGIETEEFSYGAQTATAELGVSALECPDGGAPPDAECFVRNASFEGTPVVGIGDLGADLPEWAVCWATPDVNPLFSFIEPTDGATYLGAVANANELNFSESAGGSFCEPLQAGQAVSFTIDLATSSYLGKPSALEIWGGATSCSKTELLWVSPTLTEIDVWQTVCATITPSETISHFVLWPVVADLSGAYLLADNIQRVAQCP